MSYPSVLALDPGPVNTAWVHFRDGAPARFGIETNDDILRLIIHDGGRMGITDVVVEMIASYGMAVGAEVFETCVWIGRFIQCCASVGMPPARVHRLRRLEVKQHLCHDSRANDSNIRQALLDRFGGPTAVGTKKMPGPLHGVKKDIWAALGVACTWYDTHKEPR